MASVRLVRYALPARHSVPWLDVLNALVGFCGGVCVCVCILISRENVVHACFVSFLGDGPSGLKSCAELSHSLSAS